MQISFTEGLKIIGSILLMLLGIPLSAMGKIVTPSGIDLESIAVQVPLVAGFIFFAISVLSMFLKANKERDIQWQKFIADQRKEDRESIDKLCEKLDAFGVIQQNTANTLARVMSRCTMLNERKKARS